MTSSRSLSPHPSTTGTRRGAALLVAFGLAVATGAALIGAGAALSDARVTPAVGSATANAAIVGAFYDAVNDAIRTGETDGLEPLVARDVVWCLACPGQVQTRAGLAGYLVWLHRRAPEARVTVEQVVSGKDDLAMARVRVTGLPAVAEPLLWGPVDTFRLAGDRIVERRNGGGAVALSEPLLRARFASLPPAVTGVTMARLTFAPGEGVDGLLSAGPTVLVVEAGTVAARVVSAGRIQRAGGSVETAAPGSALAAVLHRGDAITVPAGVRHSFVQQGEESAVLVGATFFFVSNGYDARPHRPDQAVFSPADGVTRDSTRARPLPEMDFLASGTVPAWPAGPVDVALGRLVLAPDGRTVPGAGETIVLAVESGAIEVDGDERQALVPGIGLVQPAGTDREFRNAGGGLVVVLVLSVAPAVA